MSKNQSKKAEYLLKDTITVEDKTSDFNVKTVHDCEKKTFKISLSLTTKQVASNEEVRKAVLQRISKNIETAMIDALKKRAALMEESGDTPEGEDQLSILD